MATFTITGRMSAKTVKKNFAESFGGTLRILKNGKPVDDGATMASLKADGCKGGELELKGNTKVAGMKKKVADLYGIDVQVYDADEKKPVDDGLTLASVGAAQPAAPAEKPVAKKEPKEKTIKETKEKAVKEPKSASTPQVAPASKQAPAPTQPATQGFSFYQLMEAALADGVVTDKERAIIIKKAVAQGYDPDEVEMMIDGRLAKMERKQKLQAQAQQQPKPQPQPKQEPPKASSPQENKNTLLEKAQKYEKIGMSKEAIQIYKKIIMDFDTDFAPAYKGLFESYQKKGDYKEALKYGTHYADLNWNSSSEIKPVRDLILKMFDEFVASNRKKDAGRFLDNYGKYLDRYGRLCIDSLGNNDFKNAKQKKELLERKHSFLMLRPEVKKRASEILCEPYNAAEYEAKYAENERIGQEIERIKEAYQEEFRKEKYYESTMTSSLRSKLS